MRVESAYETPTWVNMAGESGISIDQHCVLDNSRSSKCKLRILDEVGSTGEYDFVFFSGAAFKAGQRLAHLDLSPGTPHHRRYYYALLHIMATLNMVKKITFFEKCKGFLGDWETRAEDDELMKVVLVANYALQILSSNRLPYHPHGFNEAHKIMMRSLSQPIPEHKQRLTTEQLIPGDRLLYTAPDTNNITVYVVHDCGQSSRAGKWIELTLDRSSPPIHLDFEESCTFLNLCILIQDWNFT
ncbi:hypothetical protein C8R43DRAFT_1189091 [Mycena crocata]|nr:hypothetical protein C8R43DRAFT_1189091 [Mycena crocata]